MDKVKGRYPQQPYIMVGRTNGGRWIAVPIGRSRRRPDRWRPATAMASPSERPEPAAPKADSGIAAELAALDRALQQARAQIAAITARLTAEPAPAGAGRPGGR